jgi:hypothetical protein
LAITEQTTDTCTWSNADGAEVSAKAVWWGFHIYLNHQAVEDMLDLKDAIAKVVGAIVSKPMSYAIAAAALVEKVWIKEVAGQEGCKLTSPWISPLMLIPTSWDGSDGSGGDTALWWTVLPEGQDWSNDNKFPAGHYSAAEPSLAWFKNKLYCVHRGAGSDSTLWWTSYETGTQGNRWSPDFQLPQKYSAAGPALAVFQDRLYCFHRGANDKQLWYFTFDGANWSDDTPLPQKYSEAGPALAVFQDRLYCVHRGVGSDQMLWYFTFDGANWSDDTKMVGHYSLDGPGLITYQDPEAMQKQLLCVHRGHG